MNNGLRVIAREQRVKDYVLPQKILLAEGDIDNAEGLLLEKDLQILLEEEDVCTIRGKGYLVFDLGKEIHGGVRLLVHSCKGTPSLRIRFGESVAECCSEVGKSSATNDHSLRDFTVMTTMMSDMEWGCSGYRFLRIDTLEEGGIVRIKSVLGTFVYREIPEKGSFSCSDPRWNEIYETAAYTLKLNMQHHLWDGIKRDRLVWMGDIHPEMLGIRALYGADDCIPEALDLLRRHAPLPKFINTMPSYSLWYLVVLADYYIQNGNAEYVKEQEEYVTELVQQFTGYVDEEGRLRLDAYFLDWPSYEKEGAEAGVYALFDLAMQKSELLMSVFGKKEPAIAEARARLKKDLPDGNQKQVIAFRSLVGHADCAESAARLTENGARGFSTFMTLLLGIKFIVKPVMTTKESMAAVSKQKRFVQSVLCGAMIGFICGFIGAGGGMMMLLILTSVLGYELKTAVGTSVFIMTFTAFTGAVSHFAIGGAPNWLLLVLCVLSTLLFARVAAKFANKAKPETLNRATGVVLAVLGLAMIIVNYVT